MTYGRAEPAGDGYVRIPIDRAMQLILEKNRLKTREGKESVPEPRAGGSRPAHAGQLGHGPEKRGEKE